MALIIVSNTNDSGAGSLRQALADAETRDGADTIRFDDDLQGDTIHLQSTLLIESGRVTIDGDIDGDGDPDIEISGDSDGNGGPGHLELVLYVTGQSAVVNVQSLIISDAYAAPGPDYHALAGIVNNGTLNVRDSIFDYFFAGGANGTSENLNGRNAWAGISNSGDLSVEDSAFLRMQAIAGNGFESGYNHGGHADTGIFDHGSNSFSAARTGIFEPFLRGGHASGIGGNTFSAGYQFGHLDAEIGVVSPDEQFGNGGSADGASGVFFAGPATGAGFRDISDYLGTTGADDRTGGNAIAGHESFFGLHGADVIDKESGMGKVHGGSGNDTINGTGRLLGYGGSGNDTISNNFVFGGSVMDGGSGVDTLDVSEDITDGYSFAIDMISGNASTTKDVSFYLYARNFENFIGADSDTVVDTVFGTNGRNIIQGLAGDDILNGRGGNDKLFGGGDDDTLRGGGGKDKLVGGDGNDELFGDGGKDVLSFGKGKDEATGGGGRDIFDFDKKDGRKNKITDFQDRMDKLDLKDFNYKNKKQALKEFTDAGGRNNDKVIFNDKGTKVVIKGIDLKELGGADILI